MASKNGVLLGAAVVIGIMLAAGSANAGGGGGGGGGGANDPKPGPKGKGKIWTKPGGGGLFGGGGSVPPGVPADFDYGGNGLFIDPNCEFVVEGNLFWPATIEEAQERETLAETLAASPTNSAAGFVDYLYGTAGLTQPEEIAWKILEEASPMCVAVPEDRWGDGLAAWFDSLVARVTDYLGDYIDFGGDQS